MSSRPITTSFATPGARRAAARCLAMLCIIALCRIGSARCAEQAPIAIPVSPSIPVAPYVRVSPYVPVSPMLNTGLPPSFTTLDLHSSDEHTFSDTDFSPRKRNVLGNPKPAVRSDADIPRLGTITVWQSLNQFRSRDRVRLVTLWESSGSSLSLQAGRKGNPSLQWTSKVMNRGGATRGLLDKIVAAAVTGAGTSLRTSGARAPGSAVSSFRAASASSTGPYRIP